VGTDAHSTSVDQRQPALVDPCARIGRSGAVARSGSNAAAFLLGTFSLTAHQTGAPLVHRLICQLDMRRCTSLRKKSDPLSFLFDFLRHTTICCARLVQITPYMHTRRLGLSDSASWKFEDSYDGSVMAAIRRDLRILIPASESSPDLVENRIDSELLDAGPQKRTKSLLRAMEMR
jgi:hypothetical protein